MIKKISYLVLILCISFIVTGCSATDNNSPENVAKAMVKKMSAANYSGVDKIVYLGEEGFLTKEAFSKFIEEKGYNLKGNKKIELREEVSTTADESASVSINVDKAKYMVIKTVKVKNKWYVDLSDYADEKFIISVPTGSVVKLDGVKLDMKEYGKTETIDRVWTYNDDYDFKQKVDTYTIPTILEAKYNVEITNKNMATYKDTIHSSKSYYDAYLDNDGTLFSSTSDRYKLNSVASDKIKEEIKPVIKKYFGDLLAAAEKKADFATLSKNYDMNATALEALKTRYTKLSASYREDFYTTYSTGVTETSVSEVTYSDQYHNIYYYNDDLIIAVGKFKVAYKITTVYNQSYYKDKANLVKDSTATAGFIIGFKKNSSGQYVIVGGDYVVPYVRWR